MDAVSENEAEKEDTSPSEVNKMIAFERKIEYDEDLYVDAKVDEHTLLPGVDERTLLQRLIGKQCFEGSWEFRALPWGSIHVERDAANMVIDGVIANHSGLDREKLSTVVATTIVVEFFETKLAEDEETWELVAEKAREWLQYSVNKDVLDEVLEEVNALFKV
jgi:hypothetical protein